MRICIVTLVKSINSGSYWQARALGLVLEKLGHSVCYYDYDYTLKYRMQNYKGILDMIISQDMSEGIKYAKSLRSFSRLQRGLPLTKEIDAINCFVLGSDTIWNLESENLTAKFDELWGRAFRDKKVITYAGSVANACEELFKNDSRIDEAVSSWFAISVRDQYTREIIAKHTSKQIKLVCDPTLLLQKADYAGMTEHSKDSDFIFLYTFKDLSAEQSDALASFAKRNKLKIVQGVNGKRRKAADYSVENSPISFLQHMLNARYVVTDTFHGTMFSINLHKQFVAINRGKNKVNEALQSFGFADRLVSDDAGFMDRLTTTIDYNVRMQEIDRLREESLDFLKSNL